MTTLLRSSRIFTTTTPRLFTIKPLIKPVLIKMDYSSVPTPQRCYADFCLIPVGTGSLSVAKEIAEVQRLLKASGLKYTMHSAGTTVEGSWDEVFKVIGQAHSMVHQTGAVRIQTSMRVGTRTDKEQTAEDKVRRVEELLLEQKK
ncbi:YkoF-like protein [Coniochaeta sp. 2T2.1]|nr:YkoF-like protein [Coniochaeta sp. 2T2.1]